METAHGDAIAVDEPPRRGWPRLVLVALLSALVGAGAAVGIIVVTGSGPPTRQYNVSVFLEQDATAEQKAAIEATLPTFAPSGAVTFETRDQAWAKLQEMAKTVPEILQSATKESLPESFRLKTEGPEFDCAGVRAVRDLPGVSDILVAQLPTNGYGAKITCI